MANKQARRLISKIREDRQYLQRNKSFWPLIDSYTTFERKLLRFLFWGTVVLASIVIFLIPAFNINQKRLPLNFNIFFLPVEHSLLNWWTNYIFQFILLTSASFTFNCHFTTTILVISHICFKIDTTLISVKRFGESFADNFMRNFNHSDIKSRMVRVFDETNDVVEFTKMAQRFIAIPNLVDTIIICFTICTSLFVTGNNWLASIYCLVLIFMAVVQLAMYNIAGQIMINKLEALELSVYDTPWYNLHYKERKDILFILLVTQQLKGLKGVFYNLCNETFYQVNTYLEKIFIKLCFYRSWISHTRSLLV